MGFGKSSALARASFITKTAEQELADETLHSAITGADLHDPKAHESSHVSGGSDDIDSALAFAAMATDVLRIKFGQYTGDGGTSHSITGIGFQPKYVKIWRHETSQIGTTPYQERTEDFVDDLCYTYHPGVTAGTRPDRLISLDADGFTVDDQDADGDPNANGQVYDYLCIG